jgi:uncharacterized protein with gpF-like domain
MPRERLLGAIHASVGIEIDYRRRLQALIDEMNRSALYWIKAAYRKSPPELAEILAEDASPAATLRGAVRRLGRQWQRRFNEASVELAAYFAKEASQRSDQALARILRKAGLSVNFRMTAAMNDVLQATVNANVSLIRSIPQEHFTAIEGMVQRSVQTGRDLATLTKDLEAHFGVTRRRAELIARDQNNKATGSLQRVRQVELGIEEAIWVHSSGGKTPRPSHVRAGRDRVRYRITEGWLDPAIGKFILPGELVNCRCVSRPVIAGFT